MTVSYIIITAFFVAGITWCLVGYSFKLSLRYKFFDHPNWRSSHTQTTSLGAGIGVVATVLPAWLFLSFLLPPQNESLEVFRWLIVICTIVLTVVSFLDDLRDLSPISRLLLQSGAVIACIEFLPGPVFQGLIGSIPDTILSVVIWLWFINLFNFMDGIDGIAGVQTLSIGLGIYLIGAINMPFDASHGQALVLAAAAIGFLLWNWHPARIFLGDVGSIPLGFLLGWLLLNLASNGFWQAALILPLYYLVDSTWTLIQRILRGMIVWKPHKEHFYQLAVSRGRSHSQVSSAIGVAIIALVCLAIFSTMPFASFLLKWILIGIAAIVVGVLLAWMVFGGQKKTT